MSDTLGAPIDHTALAKGRLRVDLLGRFSARIGGEASDDLAISQGKAAALLAFLVMHPGETIQRDRLATLLWGETADRLARQSLRQYLSTLKRQLAAEGISLWHGDDKVIHVTADQVETDIVVFDRAVQSNEPAADLRASALYRGPFLQDGEIGVGPFDGWVADTRATLTARAAGLFERMIARTAGANDGAAAIACADRLVALDHMREDWQRLSLQIRARFEGRDSALAQAEVYANLLRREFDADPEPATLRTIAEIRRGAPTAVSVAPAAIVEARTLVPAPSRNRLFPARSLIAAGLAATFAVSLGIAGWQGLVYWQASADAAARSETSAMLARKGMITVAVTRFTGETDAARKVADSVAARLVPALSKVPAVRIISPQAIAALPQASSPALKASGAAFVIEGGTEASGGRITISLVEASSGTVIWSKVLDGSVLGDDVRLDEAALTAAQQIYKTMSLNKASRVIARDNPDTADALLIALSALQRPSPEAFAAARTLLRPIVEREPNNVSAHVRLGGILAIGLLRGYSEHHDSDIKEGMAAIDRVLLLAPEQAFGFLYRGALLRAQMHFEAAASAMQRSIAINPVNPQAYVMLAETLTFLDRSADALDNVRRAMRLSPGLDEPMRRYWCTVAAKAEIVQGHYAEAIEWSQEGVRLGLDYALPHALLAAAFAAQGDVAHALNEVALYRKMRPGIATEDLEREILADPTRRPLLVSGIRQAFELDHKRASIH